MRTAFAVDGDITPPLPDQVVVLEDSSPVPQGFASSVARRALSIPIPRSGASASCLLPNTAAQQQRASQASGSSEGVVGQRREEIGAKRRRLTTLRKLSEEEAKNEHRRNMESAGSAESMGDREVHRLRKEQEALQVRLRGCEAELRQRRGDADALRCLSPEDLGDLMDSLSGALSQAQREYRRRYSSQSEQFNCVICFTETRSVALQPCGHFVLCGTCSTKCGSKCPQCRASITSRSTIYF